MAWEVDERTKRCRIELSVTTKMVREDEEALRDRYLDGKGRVPVRCLHASLTLLLKSKFIEVLADGEDQWMLEICLRRHPSLLSRPTVNKFP